MLLTRCSAPSGPLRYGDDTAASCWCWPRWPAPSCAVTATGYWDSPFIFSLLTAVTVAGFARGFGFGVRIGSAVVLAVTIPCAAASRLRPSRPRTTAQWTLVLLLVALIAGYARRISGEADRQHSLALDRLGRLADANALLFRLHRVTQTLPASLDLDDVLDTTISRLRDLFDFDAAAMLLFDDTDAPLGASLRREGGVRLPTLGRRGAAHAPLRRVVRQRTGGQRSQPRSPRVVRLWPRRCRIGLYAVLPARGAIIGLLAVEHGDDHHFTTATSSCWPGFVEPVALAIDNARWFARLRTVGADEERTRIARDLHDRIGQSLAYLAFELDRIVEQATQRGEEVGAVARAAPRRRPRRDPRGPRHPLRPAHRRLRRAGHGRRRSRRSSAGCGERSGLEIELFCDRDARLPLLQEREMWRIAQEALTNVERHAEATQVAVALALQRRVRRPRDHRQRHRASPSGTGGPPRLLRDPRHAGAGVEHRRHPRGRQHSPGEGTRVRCSLRTRAELT